MRHRLGDASAHTRPPREAPSTPAPSDHCGALLHRPFRAFTRQVGHWPETLAARLPADSQVGYAAILLMHLLLAVALLLSTIAACSAPSPLPAPVATQAKADPTPGSPGKGNSTATRAPGGKPNFLSTAGSKIVDAEGREVRLTGVNWFGMETGTFAPHGLWARNWETMLDQMVELGFNVIRLPYSNRLFDPNAKPLEGIDFTLNPDLRGLTGLQIMDKMVEGAGKRGLKILLDRHRPDTEAQSKLWYTPEVSEEQWIADWRFLAERYKGNDTIIGADLHNEPAGDTTWGTGDPKTDWRLAAERAGNAIHEVNPDWLIVVEGIEKYGNDWYWMGGSLQGVAEYPVRLKVPNKLVYSAHDYGPGVHNQGWFGERDFPRNMPKIWDTHWGYIVKQNIAPVILGEFGGRSVSDEDKEGIWQKSLLAYLKENGISYTYWSLNPNSGDTGGILNDDWQTVNRAKLALLAADQAPRLAVNNAGKIQADLAPVARQKPLPASPLRVFSRGNAAEGQSGEVVLDLRVDNSTPFRAPLEQLELRYWLNLDPGDRAGGAAAYALSTDWASVGDVNLALVPEPSGKQTHYLRITFGKQAGMMPREGKLELKVRLKSLDKQAIQQHDDRSFLESESHAPNDRIALYLWGERVWGMEP